MSKTEVSGKQVKDGSIELVDLAPALAGDINTLKSDVSTLQSDVSTIQGDVATLQTDVASNGSSVSGIDGRLGLLEADSTTKNYVDTQISNLVNGSPTTLNTLNELAAALGSDANFSATVAAQIGDVASDVAALDGRVSSVESDVSTLQSDISGKASAASLATVATSGSYADLTNKPSLFSGAYTDLTGKPSLATVATSGAYSDLSGTPSLATVATSGSYNDLSDKPSLFSGSYTDLTNKPSLFDGAYSSLTGAPSLATVATSGSYTDLSNKPSLFSGSYTDLTNKPSLFDGAYSSLTGAPSLAAVATSGSYTDLTDKPSLFSGSYTDLTNKPTIPSLTGYATETYVDNKVSALVASAPAALDTLNELATALGNDANFSTTMTNALAAKANTSSLATVATSGSYADLTNKPTIPSALDDLSDVVVSSAATGQFIVHNGTSFVNSRTISSGASTPLTTVSSGGTSAEFKSSAGYNGIRVGTDGATGVPYVALDTNSSQKAYFAYWGDTAQRISLGHSSSTDIINYFNGGTYSGRVGIQTTTPGGQLAVTAAAATTKGLVVQGATSQSANLLELQNSSGTSQFAIGSTGLITGYGFKTTAGGGVSVTGLGSGSLSYSEAGVHLNANVSAYGVIDLVGNNGGFIDFATTAEDYHGRLLYDRGSHAFFFYTGANGTAKVYIDRDSYGTLWVGPGSASSKGVVVKGAASQTANLIEAQDSSGNAIFAVTPSDVQKTFNGITSKETNATVTTTNATETTLFSLTLADNTTYNLDIMVCARLSSTTAKGMYGRTRLMVYRNNAGSATIAADYGGQLEELDTYGTSGYDYVVDVSGNDVRVRVTGAASETVKWAANVKYVSVS